MRPIIPDQLWIGNAHDARSIADVLALGIRAVVDLAASEPPIQYPRDITYCRIPLNDGSANDVALLRLAVLSTAQLIKGSVPTLVACSAGMSRSPAIVAAALAFIDGEQPDTSLRRIVSTGPHDICPALWNSVKQIVLDGP